MHPSYKLAAVWRARLGILFILLLIPLRLLMAIYPAAGMLGITVLAGVCLMVWTLIPRYCGRIFYRLDEREISISSGLFFSRMTRLPRPEALYTCVYRTPFYLLTGLYGVVLWGAGVHALLPGLTQEQAQAVLTHLSQSEKEGDIR